MDMYSILDKKRKGLSLSPEEIKFFLTGYTKGEIPDYQASALLMAIAICGMSEEETVALTLGIRDSGKILSANAISGLRVDKHSTGGVGDKTSLIVMPIVAAAGLKVAKISGRGLGHTGGTIDKLESIPGFRSDLTEKELIALANEVGLVISEQTEELAPADKLLYALRDVTATVESLPLIASSIMGKKLAVNDDCIVLDVKTGSGAFMKTEEESRALAEAMVAIGKKAKKKISAVVSDMNQPLGNSIGNLLEVREALFALSGRGARDLLTLSLALAAELLHLGKGLSRDDAFVMAEKLLQGGHAKRAFYAMVAAQGGDTSVCDALTERPFPAASFEVLSPKEGFVRTIDTEAYGRAALLLGAGRQKLGDRIDPLAGILLHKKPGDYVKKGEPLCTLYAADTTRFPLAKTALLAATTFGKAPPPVLSLIKGIVD